MAIDIADIKLELDINLSDVSRDEYLERKAASTLALFERLTSRSFSVKTYTDKVSQPVGYRRLLLDHTPIQSITSIHYKGELVDPDTYEVESEESGFVIKSDGSAWESTAALTGTITGIPAQQEIGQYEVEYEAGYTDIPLEVIDAIIQQVCMEFYRRGRDPSVKSMSVLGDSVSYDSAATVGRHPAFDAMVMKYNSGISIA